MKISDNQKDVKLVPVHVEAALFGVPDESAPEDKITIANINENYKTLIGTPTGDDIRSKPFDKKKVGRNRGFICILSFRRNFPTGDRRRKEEMLFIRIFQTDGL